MSRLDRIRLAAAVLIASALVGAGTLASERTAATMAKAASAFLATLTPDQRARAAMPFDGDERLRWHFIPNEMFPRKGLTIKEMAEPVRRAAHDLLKTGLSQKGYLTVTGIMELEDILRAIEGGVRMARNKEEYYFSVFGTPSANGPWAWRVEGHHVSLRFTVVRGSVVASAPAFLGANPAEVRDGPNKGLRMLGTREDAARALLDMLAPDRRTSAIIAATAPGDILTENKNDISPLAPAGVAYASMAANERRRLMALIDVYLSMMDPEIASERRAALEKAGLDRVAFAWAGGTARGEKHYYRVQGPTFLIEYDNTQNDGNHIHSVWRDFDGDFGRDLLREHLAGVVH
jgi:hypothetical protein